MTLTKMPGASRTGYHLPIDTPPDPCPISIPRCSGTTERAAYASPTGAARGAFGCVAGTSIGRDAAPGAFLFDKGIAEELLAHKTDDLLSAPHMVAQEIRHPLEMGVGARDGIAQIETIAAQRRVRQLRAPRLLQYRRPAGRPQFAIHIAAVER